VGEVLAGYRIVSELGRGGMGIVFLAEHQHLERKVALKLLAPDLTGDENFRHRFIRESKAAAALDHPNIIPIFDAGEIEGLLYLSMRYAEGRDLKELIQDEGALAPERALRLLEQAGRALDAAHAQGLVHRDVKPQNMLVTGLDPAEHLYLLDFGLTKKLSQTSGLTLAGTFMGTVDYVSPEQIEGRQVDHRTDIYSLGCVLYECLSGVVPYERDSEMSVIHAHITAEPPPFNRLRPDLAAFDLVIATAMAKDPSDRYDSCGELVRAARRAMEAPDLAQSAPVMGATVVRPRQPAASTATAQEPSHQGEQVATRAPSDQAYPAPPQQAGPAPKPTRALMWGAAGTVLVLIAVGVFLLLAGDGDQPEAGSPGPDVETDLPARTVTDFSTADLESLLPESLDGLPASNRNADEVGADCYVPGVEAAAGHTYTDGDAGVQLLLCLYPSKDLAAADFRATIDQAENEGFSKRGRVQAVVDSDGDQVGRAQVFQSSTGDFEEGVVWTNTRLTVAAISTRANRVEGIFGDLDF
jgi:Protein kinase domain